MTSALTLIWKPSTTTNSDLLDDFFKNLTDRPEIYSISSSTPTTSTPPGRTSANTCVITSGLTIPDHPGAINGPIKGFTRRYSKQFHQRRLDGHWTDELKPHYTWTIGDEYETQLRDYFG